MGTPFQSMHNQYTNTSIIHREKGRRIRPPTAFVYPTTAIVAKLPYNPPCLLRAARCTARVRRTSSSWDNKRLRRSNILMFYSNTNKFKGVVYFNLPLVTFCTDMKHRCSIVTDGIDKPINFYDF